MTLLPGPPLTTTADARRTSPAAERNRGPLLEMLARVLPGCGLVLEIGSGTGQHAAWFAPRIPGLVWQPTEVDAQWLASVRAWVRAVGAPNLREPLRLDLLAGAWPVAAAAAVVAINVLHVTPPEAVDRLLRGAARVLPPGGPLVVYGPFQDGGVHNAESNAAFDRTLRSRNPAWGVRDLSLVRAAAARHGVPLDEQLAMPANNRALVFRRAG